VRLQAAARGFLARLTVRALRELQVCCGGLVGSSSGSPDRGLQWEAKLSAATSILLCPETKLKTSGPLCESRGVSHLPLWAAQGTMRSSAPMMVLAVAGVSTVLLKEVVLWWAAVVARGNAGGLVGSCGRLSSAHLQPIAEFLFPWDPGGAQTTSNSSYAQIRSLLLLCIFI
jgi:hypothetical protein